MNRKFDCNHVTLFSLRPSETTERERDNEALGMNTKGTKKKDKKNKVIRACRTAISFRCSVTKEKKFAMRALEFNLEQLMLDRVIIQRSLTLILLLLYFTTSYMTMNSSSAGTLGGALSSVQMQLRNDRGSIEKLYVFYYAYC